MKITQKGILILLTVVLACGLAVVSFFGAFVPTTYERDAPSMAAQGMGQDWVDLFLAVPLLLLSLIFMLRGSRASAFVYGGTVFYILYSFFIYAFGVHFNRLFLLYCLVLGTALYAFVLFVYELSRQEVESWFEKEIPIRFTGVFFLSVAASFYLLWLRDVVPAILENSVPASVSGSGLLVNPVHVLDLAIALPGLVLAALMLLKKHTLGYILAPILLVFILILTVALIGMAVALQVHGLSDDISLVFIFSVLGAISAMVLYFFMRRLRPPANAKGTSMKASAMVLGLVLSLASLLACQGRDGRWSEEWEARYEEWQPSEYVMDTLGIRPGMTVAEIGAGNGRFAVRMAARVGESGKVYANDIDPRALRFMRNRIQKERITNMEVIEGALTDPRLPLGVLDLACLVNTYDDLSRPVELLRNTLPALKPEGVLVIMVYDTEKVGDLRGHAVPKERVILEAEAAGFTLLDLDESLSRDTIYFFRPAKR